ncbi:PREDICTED: agamous-like MADS-box protein AGL82 [Camelina sativa]|uniref:Agamous-like MADS-box protein AGL82 n=1 Tax=Camelina sativa TaxID=90675 RepID=A0ABM0WTU7_CAMSA|nr:PREDICTED: agamous-like MADS-box protein AGL82 [Camelina sativa]
MGRKMVKMEKIPNEKTRITTYKKRKACLYKKASEFSTLCGVDTCLVVYGPSRAGDEMVAEPELWPKDESKVREIITKYRDIASSSCTKTYTVQECLEKNNTKVENSKTATKYQPWDKQLDKCSLNELYAVFMAVENKIQEATNKNQTFPDSTSWSQEQLGLSGYNQQCLEQFQLFPMPTMEHNEFSFFPFNNQVTSTKTEVPSFSHGAEPMITNGQTFFYGSCSDSPYGPLVQRTAYMEPIQWGLGNSMFNDMKQFPEYPFRFAQNNDLEDSSKHPM